MLAFLNKGDTPALRIAREAEIARVAAAAHAARPLPPKKKLGRPFSTRPLEPSDGIDIDDAAAADEPDIETKKKRKYIQWFSSPLIGEILRTYSEQRSARATVTYLQTHRPLNGYEQLTESTVRNWFDKEHKLLPRFQQLLATGYKAGPGTVRALAEYPDVEQRIMEVLLQMREGHKTGISVNIDTIRWVMKSIISERCPQLFEKITLSKTWICEWAREHMKWTWRATTTAASKLPQDWQQQGVIFAKRIAATMETYEIHPSLVINADQAGIHLVPSSARTYETSGSKAVPVAGADDKRQITVVVTSALDGSLLPLQMIFTGKSSAVLPPHTADSQKLGFHLTMSENHWSNQATTKQFIERIILPRRAAMIAEHKLKEDSHVLLLLDVWSVHISLEFRTYLAQQLPFIHLVYIPANCTSKLQVADVALNYPFKHGFKSRFNAWAAATIDEQICLDNVVGLRPFCGMTIIKKKVLEWALASWQSLAEEKALILKGWQRCVMDFYDVMDKDKRIEAMRLAVRQEIPSNNAVPELPEQAQLEEQEPELDDEGFIAEESEDEDKTEKEILKEKVFGTRKSTRNATPAKQHGYMLNTSQLKFA